MSKNKTKLLLCEDDASLSSVLKEYLGNEDFEVDVCPDGEAGCEAFKKNEYDLCILDVIMPKKDGFALAEDIRNMNKHVPIIFLTARSMREDVVRGFNLGADDYLSKPFSMEELKLRIQSILKRTKQSEISNQTIFRFGIFELNAPRQTLTYTEGGEKISKRLTTKESELLRILAQYENQIVERNTALKQIWFEDNYFNARSMDVYITKIRKLLKVDPEVMLINIHGKGYKLITPKKNEHEQ